ncbi:hypothetical protein FB45DRAFT_1007378 [Roridomyces roridus]|uniref:F-box domain-containing protein n=1 Tax=Roridomyces roridus TaxID=1738132 RepID=A0AAD7BF24_9AGAR|nr:hypothetical protein FB45DRAFT_1007378 [Roridomyces roridus]
MGQGWQTINLDKREAFGWEGKLAELLFSPSDMPLVFSLAVARAAKNLPDCDSFIFPITPGKLVGNFDGHRLLFPQRAAQRASMLLSLPVELIDKIISHLPLFADIAFLCITCQYLWEIGRRLLDRHITDELASLSWAGDRIVCIGDFLSDVDEVPDHVFTQQDREDFRDHEENGYPLVKAPGDRGQTAQLHLVRKFYWRDIMAHKGLTLLQNPLDRRTHYGTLRNLSQRQFVRGAALVEWKEETEEIIEAAGAVGFDEILLSRICYSPVDNTALLYKGVHQGVWAGDRFDLVECEWLESLQEEDEAWTDVSGECLGEVAAIWRSEFLR